MPVYPLYARWLRTPHYMVMTTYGDRLRTRAAMALSSNDLRNLPGLFLARVLQVNDIPQLLSDARASKPHVTETIPERAFSKRAVRRRLVCIAGEKRRVPRIRENGRALVRIPEWSSMGKSSFGMAGNYYDSLETETLALLALWVGEGFTPRPGSCTIDTAYHPFTSEARNFLEWRVLESDWTAEQLEILSTLLRDGVEHEDAIEIARNPSW